MNHPLGQAIPLTGHWFNMPDRPMSGDSWTPKSQRPGYGPTLRFISSPGDEANAVLQLPGGVSGNPLSPYYRAGHADWISGDPTPLLPGEAETTLRLLPE
jgi:penicillin amidase